MVYALLSGAVKLVWLKRLKASIRNSSFVLSFHTGNDLCSPRSGESLRLGGHLISADLDVEELVIAVIVGLRRRGDAGGDVFQSHCRFGQNGAVRIANRAEHDRCVELGERGRRRHDYKKTS